MKKLFKIISISVLLVFMMTAFVACTPARRPEPAPAPTPDGRTDPERTRLTEPVPRDQQPEVRRDPVQTENVTNRANRIADRVTDLEDVEKAAVVITGRTAMVGIQIDERHRGRLTEQQKNQVEDRVQATDNAIDTVIVTADPALFDRTRAVARDIEAGRPISGLINEIDEIINRAKPQVQR